MALFRQILLYIMILESSVGARMRYGIFKITFASKSRSFFVNKLENVDLDPETIFSFSDKKNSCFHKPRHISLLL